MVAFHRRVIWRRLALTVIVPVSVVDRCIKVKSPLRLFPLMVVSHAVMSLLIVPNRINGSSVALPVRWPDGWIVPWNGPRIGEPPPRLRMTVPLIAV
jgi:hypothetical protein